MRDSGALTSFKIEHTSKDTRKPIGQFPTTIQVDSSVSAYNILAPGLPTTDQSRRNDRRPRYLTGHEPLFQNPWILVVICQRISSTEQTPIKL